MTQPNVKSALAHLDAHLPDFQRTLVELSRIPSVSAEGYPPEEVRRSAFGVAEALHAAGVENNNAARNARTALLLLMWTLLEALC